AFSHSVVFIALGGFAMQFMVQGAWGVIPAHLNELSPANLRGTFPGFTYQMGNLISANAAQLEAAFATHRFPLPNGHPDYAKALSIIALGVFIAVIVLTLIGYFIKPENRNTEFTASSS
ncbi:MAG: MFS transporter, partial [Candidatus Eremiobacteraeota bacterium]|nr:MFS transporter [Candidatus Eremiobacteraeota bacterium]